MATKSSQVDFITFDGFYCAGHTRSRYMYELQSIVAGVHHTQAPTSTIYHLNMHTRYYIGIGEAVYLHGVWVSRSPVTAPVVAHTPIISMVLDIPSPLSPSSIWVRVRVSGRRCYRFSGLYMYAFHSSGDVADGIRRRRIAVLMAYNATTSSTLVLVQCSGHWAHHIRSKSTYENDTGGRGGVRRGVGPRLLLLMVRLLAERYYRALSRWKYYALCSQSLSLCFVVSATAPALLTRHPISSGPKSLQRIVLLRSHTKTDEVYKMIPH